MLSNEGCQTPRPRPPAQMRRTTSKGFTPADSAPPPPYALEFPFLKEPMESDMSDPVAATARMLGIQLDTELDLPPMTEQDISQKSREELANLILKAEHIIRVREKELNVAANLGKSLLETNEALKLRHDALLSRLPALRSPGSTLPLSSTSVPKASRSDAWTTDDDVPDPSPTLSRIHSRSNSIMGSVRGSPTHSRTNSITGSTPRRGHVRRLSASPSALIALSETNAELIAELTRLRVSTDSAKVDGAQRLRQLEREIGGLKTELEATQLTNAELEEKVKEQFDEERKREREERLRKLRLGDDTRAEESDHETRDFAPQGSGVDAWDSVAGTPRKTNRTRVLSDSSHDADTESAAESDAASSVASSLPASQQSTFSRGEYAVVAQLYRKVGELQQTNAELGARNRTISGQLARAEREALEIKRMYEEIGEEIEEDAKQSDECDDIGTGTIRASMSSSPMRSLLSPRSSRSVTPKASSLSFKGRGLTLQDPFDDETPRAGTGSCRALGNKSMLKGPRTLRNRKPLTNTLFAPPTEVGTGAVTTTTDSRTTPSILLVQARSPKPKSKFKAKGKLRAKAKLTSFPPSRSPFTSLGVHRKLSASSYTSGTSVRSSASASSFLSASGSSFTTLAQYVGRPRPRRSLGSELGDEFGADWGMGAEEPDHGSLFNDKSFGASSEIGTYMDGEYGSGEEEEEEDPALVALRHALTPPYAGRLLELDEHIIPIGALRASPGEAFQLVAHAVASRPNRWLESDDNRMRGPGQRAVLASSTTFFAPRGGEDPWETTRYPDIQPSAELPDEDVRRKQLTGRRDRALGRMVSTAHARHVSDTFELVPSASQLQTADYHPRRSRRTVLVETIKRTSADVLIELWIFLQFVVVICMFVYTMSKRGPREVLGAPPRRSA